MIRNDSSGYGSITLTLGIVSVIVGFLGLYGFGSIRWYTGYALLFIIPILVFFFGTVGIVKDRKVVMASIGLTLELVYIIFMLMGYFRNYA